MEADERKLSRSVLRRQLSAYLTDLKVLLTGDDVPRAQAVLKRLLSGKLAFIPQADGSYRFKGTGTVQPVIGGLIQNVASPTGGRDTYEPGHGETYELPLAGTVRKVV